MATAFITFTKQAVREQRIPFIISRNIPNDETLKAIRDTKNSIGVSKRFYSVKDLMDNLNADN